MATQSYTPVPLGGDLYQTQHGSDDIVFGSLLFGDAFHVMFGRSRGGNDIFFGVGADTVIYGDAKILTNNSRGGNDLISGADGSDTNTLYGDGFRMTNRARGGDDTLIGGDHAAINKLIGDAENMAHYSRGGDDVLKGGDFAGLNMLWGDAVRPVNRHDPNGTGDPAFGNDTLLAHITCGNDVLISGEGCPDQMWGDAGLADFVGVELPAIGEGMDRQGADRFVFLPNNGDDIIFDFGYADRIDLTAFHFASTDDLLARFRPAGNNELYIDLNFGDDIHGSIRIEGYAIYWGDFIL